MELSIYLRKWRAERPDEWTMDEFIRKADALESLCKEWFLNPLITPYAGANRECMYCGAVEQRDGIIDHSSTDCPYMKYKDTIK